MEHHRDAGGREILDLSTPELLARASRSHPAIRLRGLAHEALHLEVDGSPVVLAWPPAAPVRKSAIERLVRPGRGVRAAPTRALDRHGAAPFGFPCCLKPDAGSLGAGFRRIDGPAQWQDALCSMSCDDDLVVQPFLAGTEYRVTACADGAYAAARRVERVADLTRWSDATDDVPADVVSEVHAIAISLGAPGVGCDLIRDATAWHVIDVNAAPSLCIHHATDPVRPVEDAFLACWVALERGRTDAAQPGRPPARRTSPRCGS